ncbi:iron-hydroxamate ABC transporter substrate-binding protein [Paenibacillus tarimensis]|uniref:iron-hydroxamate ABC transporter substrate-binding protein n=1 Tax=Paenibacillus tarimensis TaxID=416012 RepID=UPI001F2EE681|nr:iron-hydroxamate ABC transporter substrate-binding protein [Paenibacillus tarimensis]MCF2944464.1 iron-hydroxamate ABC transporter substrate-binding protein [Paenibacillus tarimensis]
MKKTLWMSCVILISCVILAGCGSNNASSVASSKSNNAGNTTTNQPAASEAATVSYETTAGAVEIPADPQRIIVLSGSYAGHALFLGAPVIAIDSFTYENPLMADYIDGVQQVSAENLEQIIELDPDLIITDDYATNIEQLNNIAPTLGLTYSSQDYLTRVLEIGKIVNKQKEAEDWVADFKARAVKAGEEVRAKLGDDTTVTVIESWDKELYVFGDNYARGTEILYDAMGLKRSEGVEKFVAKEGYSAISPEVLPELGGDYIVFSKSAGADNSFLETETYKNIEAVKNNRVLTADAAQFYFNDPITLEYQLQFFLDGFLGN